MAIPRIEQFITALKTSKQNKTAIENLCANELMYLRQAYNVQDKPNEDGIYPGLLSYMKAVSDYRKAIYFYDRNHIAYGLFKASELETLHKSEQNKLSEQKALFDIESAITDIDEFINTSVQLCQAISYIDNILGLAALTGRRVAEIGYFSNFEHCDKDEFDKIYGVYGMFDCEALTVKNLAKKEWYKRKDLRIENNEELENEYVIPVLYDSNFILNAFHDLRNRKCFESAEQFHNAASKEISKRMRKHYADYLGNRKAHDLRAAYCRILFDNFANAPEKAYIPFISLVLCQKSPVNYAKFS